MLLAFRFQSPGPIVFEIGSVSIRWYGFLIASAVLIGVTLSQYLAKRRNINPDLIGDLAIWLIIAAIPSARLYYVIFQWQEYAQRPGDILAIWKGGIAIHGAIIGGTLAAMIFARLNKISVWQLLDIVVPALALGQAIGRWGNFFNSEAFGKPTHLPWKLYIPPSNRPPQYLDYEYFHPTFLYESIWNLLVFLLLMYIFLWGLKHRERLKVGTIALVYFVAYSIGRFWIEGLRIDSLMFGSLKMAQMVSLTLILLSSIALVWVYWFRRSLPDVVPSSD
ncbi:prolipoprotein diacylglyceryl transferase [Pleurocapsa sp. PCC 7327]|uniref:prolipoprotein diacylglyceryl transferase n=1 Tax=Pleurocapsa sp. PCC 7327 TaxID=118163 RepID=UPI00029FC9A6|nr:prolipoprotein diacylglyceryl transferase [Pleurocapsa sp. PCC 7327]AFY78442.1 prolipoprotein diacylglyceryl transferase [Pleurocapsa sp. PCC 7327]